jgi:hypothetical protein
LKENNLEECCEYVEGDFKFLHGLNYYMQRFCFIFAYNEIFISLFLEKDNIFYAVLLYVGPSEYAGKYKYKVECTNKDDTEGVPVMHLSRCFHENLDDMYRAGSCGSLHYDVLSCPKDEGSMKYKWK